MMGSRVGFVIRIKAEHPGVIVIHCSLHQDSIAFHRLQPDIHTVLNDVKQTVNFAKARNLNSPIFEKNVKRDDTA